MQTFGTHRAGTNDGGYKNAGKYEIEFDTSDLISGVYFYKLEVGKFNNVKKFIFLKLVMIRYSLLLFLFFVTVNKSLSQISKLESKFYLNEKKIDNELLISIGSGYNVNFNSSIRDNFLFSVDIIPRISRNFFLDFKLDGIKKGQRYSTIINIIPGYKIALTDDERLSIYLGGGIAAFFYPGGHIGLDASAIVQTKLEYNLKHFFLNSEIRKPIFFSEDSGHLDLFLNVNFGVKI